MENPLLAPPWKNPSDTHGYTEITPWFPSSLSGLEIATTSALLQILGILSWRMQ